MQKFFYSVYDSKAKVFSNPFTSVNHLTATRDFNRAANDPSSDISKFPEDYTLYEIGSFDDVLGILVPHENPTNLGMAIQFKES